MVNRKPNAVILGILSLTFAISVFAQGTASADEPTLREPTLREPTLRELATASRAKAARTREATIRLILSRQKGDQLKVYLRGSRGMFINGKSISTGILSVVIQESGLKQAVITTSPGVHPDRVTEVEKRIQKDGIEKIEAKAPKQTLREVAAESRAGTARNRETTLREILSRQKGDQLKVYLNSRGAYVNGKSVSSSILTEIVSKSGLEEAVLTAEPYVSEDKVAAWKALIRKSGIEASKQSAPNPK